MSHPLPPILSPGTQIVTRRALSRHGAGIPAGTVAVVTESPPEPTGDYRVRLADGNHVSLPRADFRTLAEAVAPDADPVAHDPFDRVILRSVVGSRAYGLDGPGSDTDRRGVFLPPAEAHWSLAGVPEQVGRDDTQEAYWELRKFLVLALKSNPTALEVLYSPHVEFATPLGEELLGLRDRFLSKLVYQTCGGYVASQFKKLCADERNHGRVRWKHAAHLVRLLLAGTGALRGGGFPVAAGEHTDLLRAIRGGERPLTEVDALRLELHRTFDAAFASSPLPDRPDTAAADAFLRKARRLAVGRASGPSP